MFGINAPKYAIGDYVLTRFKFKHLGHEMVLTVPVMVGSITPTWKKNEDGSLASCAYKYDVFKVEITKVSKSDEESEFVVQPVIGSAHQNISESDIMCIAYADMLPAIEFAK